METLAELIGRSPEIEALRAQVRRLLHLPAGHRAPPVLLLGETGTGKGLVARLLHQGGPRAPGPFTDVNCAAIPETLLEAELFGFERGAFTGALQAKPGLFQTARGGTLFLDEVATLPTDLQAKLLTAIESRQVRRLGSTRSDPVDVWILAATSEDLTHAMQAQRFRPELYHRLATVVLGLPPLRARGQDVLELARHFLARAAADHGAVPRTLADDACAALLAYSWPGNVRELANVLERVTLLEDGMVITAAMLGLPASGGERAPDEAAARQPSLSLGDLRRREREELIGALTHAVGNITRAAAALGIPRNTFRYRMAKHGLSLREAVADEPPGEVSPAATVPSVPEPSVAVPGIRWEQRLVTVLGVQLDAPEGTASFQLAGVLEGLISKVTGFGARIEDLTPVGLVAVFGVGALEDGPRRAVHAARAAIQTLRAGDDPSLGGLSARCAVHLGRYLIATGAAAPGLDARARREAWTTMTVLLEQVGPNGIVLDAAAARLVERRFGLEPTGHDVVPGYRVMVGRERPGFEVGGRILTPLVGRGAELAQLRHALARAAAGHGQVVAIVGEPGVGKSRLVWEVVQTHRDRGWLIGHGSAISYGQATPYLPVIDLLKAYFHAEDRDDPRQIRDKVTARIRAVDRALEPGLPALLELLDVPVDDDRWQKLDPARRRQRTLDAIERLWLREAQIQPVLLVMEDLHWVDSETQALLDRLVERLPTARLCLLVDYRPEYQPRWGSKTFYTQQRLDPLPPESARELLRGLLGEDAGLQRLTAFLIEQTEGNPFFLEEAVRTLVETGVLGGPRSAHHLARPIEAVQVPSTVEAVLAARMERLSPDARQLIQAASVIGKDVPFALLEAIADIPEDSLRRELTHLQAAEFLYERSLFPDLEYTFKHALTHEVAYGSVLQDRRRLLHSRIADAIETLYPDRLSEHIERLAHHAFRGAVWEKAMTYLRQAGARAFARSANREAVAHLEHALTALSRLPGTRETAAQAIDVRFDLGNSLYQLAEFAGIEGYLREAEAMARGLDDQRRLGWVSVYMCRHHLIRGGHVTEVRTYVRRVEAIAEAFDDLPLQVAAQYYGAFLCHNSGDYRGTEHVCRRLAELLQGDRIRERFGLAVFPAVWSGAYLARGLAERGEFDEGDAGREAIRLAEAVDHPFSLIFASLGVAYLHSVRGELSQAARLLERALALCGEDTAILTPLAMASLGYVYAWSGRVGEGVSLLQRALTAHDSAGIAWLQTMSLAQFGEAYLLASQVEDARACADRAVRLARERGERGHEAWALRLLGEVASHQAHLDPETAEARYSAAMALASELGMRPLVAHCHLGLGRLYRRRGTLEQAREHLATATAMYGEMGMTYWLEKLEKWMAGARMTGP
jgi:DNA-binding NtrC family response regulator/tetratricopeptide (TPR) repeat protein